MPEKYCNFPYRYKCCYLETFIINQDYINRLFIQCNIKLFQQVYSTGGFHYLNFLYIISSLTETYEVEYL